jgi:hypothetical protein
MPIGHEKNRRSKMEKVINSLYGNERITVKTHESDDGEHGPLLLLRQNAGSMSFHMFLNDEGVLALVAALNEHLSGQREIF